LKPIFLFEDVLRLFLQSLRAASPIIADTSSVQGLLQAAHFWAKKK
jgi:hypothetical protein